MLALVMLASKVKETFLGSNFEEQTRASLERCSRMHSLIFVPQGGNLCCSCRRSSIWQVMNTACTALTQEIHSIQSE